MILYLFNRKYLLETMTSLGYTYIIFILFKINILITFIIYLSLLSLKYEAKSYFETITYIGSNIVCVFGNHILGLYV